MVATYTQRPFWDYRCSWTFGDEEPKAARPVTIAPAPGIPRQEAPVAREQSTEQPVDGSIIGLVCTTVDGCPNPAAVMGVDSSPEALERSSGTGEQVHACREHTSELLDRGVIPTRIGPPPGAEPVTVSGGNGAMRGTVKRSRT